MNYFGRWTAVAFFGLFVLVTACGGPRLEPGYYLAEGDWQKTHYPILVVRHQDDWLQIYAVSALPVLGFGEGEASQNKAAGQLGSALLVQYGERKYYQGIFRAEGWKVFYESRVGDKPDAIPTGELLQTGVLLPVPKEKAIEALQSLFKNNDSRKAYPRKESCERAFEMPCTRLIPNMESPAATP